MILVVAPNAASAKEPDHGWVIFYAKDAQGNTIEIAVMNPTDSVFERVRAGLRPTVIFYGVWWDRENLVYVSTLAVAH